MIGGEAADRDHACNRESQSGNGIQQHGGALNVQFEAKVELGTGKCDRSVPLQCSHE